MHEGLRTPDRVKRGRLATLAFLALAWSGAHAQDLRLPNQPDTVKFAVIGDSGTGSSRQYEVSRQMTRFHALFPFDVVITLGDNIYGGQDPEDLVRKFEAPYKALLDGGVRFHASLGNHDDPRHRFYEPWNMNGERYYTFARKNVRFFALNTNNLDPAQLEWLEAELRQSSEDWKIAYFHHPLYSSAVRHGSDPEVRTLLQPLFIKYGVHVVFSGHDHVYERIRPQNGIHYFVAGASGQLRPGDLRRSSLTAAGFDRDQTFMLAEVRGDTLVAQAVSRLGGVVDLVTISRQPSLR